MAYQDTDEAALAWLIRALRRLHWGGLQTTATDPDCQCPSNILLRIYCILLSFNQPQEKISSKYKIPISPIVFQDSL